MKLQVPHSLRICCWNILADVYAHHQSLSYSLLAGYSKKSDWEERFSTIGKYLSECNADILCLQEIDHFNDSFKPFLSHNNYDTIYYQRPERKDGCLIAYKSEAFDVKHVDYISFDDIADIIDTDYIRENYRRRNVAIFAHFRLKSIPNHSSILSTDTTINTASNDQKYHEFIITNSHLYWNPNKPEIKLAQTQYLLDRLNQFISQYQLSPNIPIIATGDYNSLPYSQLYDYLTRSIGFSLDPTIIQLTGKHYKPNTKFLCDHSLSRLCRWMRILGIDTAIQPIDSDNKVISTTTTIKKNDIEKVTDLSHNLEENDTKKEITETEFSNVVTTDTTSSIESLFQSSSDTTKTTNIDAYTTTSITTTTTTTSTATTITQTMIKPRITKSNMFDSIFKRARDENRVILTTSKQMIERSNCPDCLLVPSSKSNNLDLALAEIVYKFSLQLNPDRFLTVCGKCGGEIIECNINDILNRDRSLLALSNNTDTSLLARRVKFLPTDRPVYACTECYQPYWWNDHESSSPARAMKMADKLYKSITKYLSEDMNASTLWKQNMIEQQEKRKAKARVKYGQYEKITSDNIIDNIIIKNHDDDDKKEDVSDILINENMTSSINGIELIDLRSKNLSGNGNTLKIQSNNDDLDINELQARFKNRDNYMSKTSNVDTGDANGVDSREKIISDSRSRSNSTTSTSSSSSSVSKPFRSSYASSSEISLPYDVNTSYAIENVTSPLHDHLSIEETSLCQQRMDPPGVPKDTKADIHENSHINNSNYIHNDDNNGSSVQNTSSPASIIFMSAYKSIHGQEPIMTNWCHEFKGTLDYIFYTPNPHIRIKNATVYPQVDDNILNISTDIAVVSDTAKEMISDTVTNEDILDSDTEEGRQYAGRHNNHKVETVSHINSDTSLTQSQSQCQNITSCSDRSMISTSGSNDDSSNSTNNSNVNKSHQNIHDELTQLVDSIQDQLHHNPTSCSDSSTSLTDVVVNTPLPNKYWPSDHFMVVTDIELL